MNDVFSQVEEMEAYKEKAQAEAMKNLPPDTIIGTGATATRLTPTIQPADTAEREKTFSTIRQGNVTNALTKLRAVEGKTATVDQITGTATITRGDLTVTIPAFTVGTGLGLKTSAYQLLDALTVALTESGAKSPAVALSLEEYMAKRGLKDKKEARKQATEGLETLFNAKISFTKKGKKGQPQDFHDVHLIDSKGIRKGVINVSFGSTFYNLLLGYTVMSYPAQLWTLNSKRNPNSFYLLRKIAEHKNMNVNKKNEDTIAVKTLLKVAPYLPSYDEVMQGNKNVTARIIDPFERDMDALSETLGWEYCHSNGEPLTQEEMENFNYDLFKDLLIRTAWRNYPDQTARLKRKAESIEKAKKRKPRASKKKADTPAEQQ